MARTVQGQGEAWSLPAVGLKPRGIQDSVLAGPGVAHLHGGGLGPGLLPRSQLPQHHAKGPHVRLLVVRLRAQHLRRAPLQHAENSIIIAMLPQL